MHHHIAVGAWVHGILVTANIVGCVIDPKDFCCIDAVVHDLDGIAVIICKVMVIAVLIRVQESRQEVILELDEEVLQRV
jgi:hypothetical protein